jgi:DNA-binding sugar fermentation-stimulating protein
MADIVDPMHPTSPKYILAHSPSLGVSGHVVKDSRVIVSARKKNTTTAKSKYTIDAVITLGTRGTKNVVIGVNPHYANEIIENVLKNQWFEEWKYVKDWQREKTVQREKKKGKSRFDFVGQHATTGEMVVIEVKSVPLVDNDQVAIFPDGYRKRKEDTVSERAVKHLNELEELLRTNKKMNAYMVYVIQRGDAIGFRPAPTDPIYQDAFLRAKAAGVRMVAVMVQPQQRNYSNTSELLFTLQKIWLV